MTSPSDPTSGPTGARRTLSCDTPAIKVALIAGLMLLLLIPMYLIDGVNRDRVAHREDALSEYRKSWGPAQTVLGPILIVPYIAAPGERRQFLHITPQHLKVVAGLSPEIRRRGLFQVAVYQASVALSGDFRVPKEGLPTAPEARILWEDSAVILGATDLRGLRPGAAISWAGRDLPLDDGRTVGDAACTPLALIGARASLEPPPDAAVPFAVTLDVKGTGVFRIAPIGRETDVTITTPPTPVSFSGIALPNFRRDDNGIVANWVVANNAASGRRDWWSGRTPTCVEGSGAATNPDRQISLELVEAVPLYHMAERASKYAILFLTLSFLTYFLFETISRVAIHLVQYGLLGLSLTLFGLLLISLGEALGFTAAYAVSSVLVLLQASLFTWSVTKRSRLAGIFAAILAALFGFLYVVLSLESYALLVGSVALFAALSVVMAVTRHIQWSGPAAAPNPSPPRREAGRGFLS